MTYIVSLNTEAEDFWGTKEEAEKFVEDRLREGLGEADIKVYQAKEVRFAMVVAIGGDDE